MVPSWTSDQPLEAKDVVLLSVLGAVHDSRAPLNEIVESANNMAPHEWQPTADIVGDCVLSAVNKRLLTVECPRNRGSALQVEITETGRSVLRHLLRRSIPCQWGGFSRTCMAAKLRFLGFLDPQERLIEIQKLAEVHRQDIEALRRRLNAHSARIPQPALWLHHEIERLQWELSWLDRLRSDCEAAERTDGTSPRRPTLFQPKGPVRRLARKTVDGARTGNTGS